MIGFVDKKNCRFNFTLHLHHNKPLCRCSVKPECTLFGD
nr:MAG TPA: hypothetical protein [Caudoviricetes sp.]